MNQLIRQFFHIKQNGSVSDNIGHFDDLVHQVLAHDPTISQVVITNCFVDGLRADIRNVVLVHRPIDLCTFSSLALL